MARYVDYNTATMLEGLEFIAGDPNMLAGRCVLFARNASGTDNPFNPAHPALAVASDPAELLDILSSIMPMNDEMRDSIMSKLRESTEMWTRTMFGQGMFHAVRDVMKHGMDNIDVPDDIKDQMREQMAFVPDEETGVPFHGCFLPLVGFDPDIIEPYKSSSDIVKASDVPNITYAGLVLAGHAQHYLATYFMQREKALGWDEEESEMPAFRDLPKQEFLSLLDGKVSELMYAYETGGETERLLKDLRKLTSGTYFLRDILNLAHLAETNHPKKIELMGLYLKRIHLLVRERYEEIPPLDREIRSMQDG